MSIDPRHRVGDGDVQVKADELVVEAMLVSMSPGEIESQERRIVDALGAITGQVGTADSSTLRIPESDASEESTVSSRRRWSALGGIGAGLAAMLAVALILLASPGEA